jgi:hypothetical protein
MNERKYEIMEAHLKGELTVLDLIDRIVELEEKAETKEPTYEVQNYVFKSRLDASKILKALDTLAERYKYISVADYYELVGIQPSYVDNAFGWSCGKIKEAFVVPRHPGHYIKLPPVEVLN